MYLAQDTEFDRRVAVKVPKLPLLLDPDEIEAYRKEARTVARLDHPNIVPVLHSGSTDQFPVFVGHETFSAQSASPKARLHQKAARVSHPPTPALLLAEWNLRRQAVFDVETFAERARVRMHLWRSCATVLIEPGAVLSVIIDERVASCVMNILRYREL